MMKYFAWVAVFAWASIAQAAEAGDCVTTYKASKTKHSQSSALIFLKPPVVAVMDESGRREIDFPEFSRNIALRAKGDNVGAIALDQFIWLTSVCLPRGVRCTPDLSCCECIGTGSCPGG